jgi:hypothetical protein
LGVVLVCELMLVGCIVPYCLSAGRCPDSFHSASNSRRPVLRDALSVCLGSRRMG